MGTLEALRRFLVKSLLNGRIQGLTSTPTLNLQPPPCGAVVNRATAHLTSSNDKKKRNDIFANNFKIIDNNCYYFHISFVEFVPEQVPFLHSCPLFPVSQTITYLFLILGPGKHHKVS